MTSHKTIASGLEGRYAVALFELADKNGVVEKTEEELTALETLLEQNEEFSKMALSPIFSMEEQLSASGLVAKTLKLSDIVANLLGVLATNRRLNRLGSVIESYKRIAASERGEVTAEVISACKLDAAQQKSLKNSLKKAVGQDVIFETKVDESLLGGLIVKVGSRMIDSSLKSKLENLKVSMKGV